MKFVNCDLEARFDWALNSVKEIKDDSIKNVFDIGSGKELLKNNLLSLGLNYSAYDIDPPNATVRQWNVDNVFPYEDKADVVVLLEVIEHLNNPWLGIKNIADVIRPGGYLILSTPNPTWSESRLSMFARGVLSMFTQEDLDLNHHVFTPWKHVVYKILADNGFKVTRFDGIGGKTSITAAPFWGLKMPMRFLYRAAKVIIEKRDAGSIGPLCGFIAQKVK